MAEEDELERVPHEQDLLLDNLLDAFDRLYDGHSQALQPLRELLAGLLPPPRQSD